MWAKLWGLLGCSHPKSSLACHSTLHLSWKPLSRRCAHGLLKGSVRVARLWQGSVWYLSHLLSAPHPGEPGGVLCLILAVGWHWTSLLKARACCALSSLPHSDTCPSTCPCSGGGWLTEEAGQEVGGAAVVLGVLRSVVGAQLFELESQIMYSVTGAHSSPIRCPVSVQTASIF